ncbi:MAG: hypothetical protein JF611_04940, partial [Betaproteobacteria bacterium]|nr:hypothetical protein [Betaproteobacteria bacterium]
MQPEARTMTVGPDSAGAFPGPVCYSRGGTVPAVTDAQLVLGYLDPENFAGGRMKLDKKAATDAIAALGGQIGMSALECAAGACRIVELHMADIIRKVTVEKGFDPRDFVLFAFGGAGPAHAGVFARELGIKKVIIPQRKAASTWCAFGAAMGHKNVITTDMGGTSFDVSIIYEGKPAYSFISNTDQYEYFLPKVDLQAIGAGGGSLIRVQPEA